MIQLTVIIAIRNYIFETKMMSDCSLLVVIESSEAMIFAVMSAIFAIAERSLKNSGLQRGFNP